jgi:putative ABC transport system permease protein
MLRRNPAFTATAVATLAIGVGATTAIFSTVNATLLRPLPYPRADELVDVRTRYVDGRVTTGFVASVEIESLKSITSVVAAVAGFGFNGRPNEVTLIREDGTPMTVMAAGITRGFFEVFGLPLTLGRPFTADEHASIQTGPGPPPAVVLSHRFWTTQFGSDPSIVGKTLRFAEVTYGGVRVVGVGPAGLEFPEGTDFWINLRLDPLGASHNFGAIVRLRSGATLEQLRSAGNAAMVELARTEPTAVGREYVLRSFLASVVGDLRPILLIVLGATAVLLVLACVNVSNLLLARGLSRAHEVALRTALGASRGRIIGQLLAQAMVLAVTGSLVGLAVAFVTVRGLLVLGASELPRLHSVPFDWRVLSFSLVVLVVSGLAMGVAPALRLATADIRTLLSEGGRRTTQSLRTSRIMSAMIVAEVALAIVLVAGAGWLIQSFNRLRLINPGFVADGRLLIDVRPTRTFKDGTEASAWSEAMLERVRRAAGDAVVGSAASVPFRPERDGTTSIELPDEAPDPTRVRSSRLRVATTGFFEALGIRLVGGRTFTADDRRDTQPVAVVNRAFVRRYFPGSDPLAAQFAHGFPKPDRTRMVRIIGVVDDVRSKSLAEEGEATFYLANAQLPFPFLRHSVVVSARGGSSEVLSSTIREALVTFDPNIVASFIPVRQIVADTLSRQELGMTLMLVFGATALLLAAIGLYGVIAYAAAQRRAELATRIALGASGRQVFWLMMGSGQRLMLMGIGLGLALAYAGGRVVSGSIFAMRASDPLVLVSAAGVVALVACVATVIPALRASRHDAVQALRSE